MTTPSRRRAGMINGWQALAAATIELRYVGVPLILFNGLWLLCSLPLITIPPATAALYVVTKALGQHEDTGWREFLAAMRACWWVSWRWALLNAMVAGIVYANLTFYSTLDEAVRLPLSMLWTGLAAAWVLVQMYCFPVLLEQERSSVQIAVRNALVMVLRHPAFTLTFALVAGFVLFISVSTPYVFALITPALLAFVYNRAVAYLVQVERGIEPELDIDPAT